MSKPLELLRSLTREIRQRDWHWYSHHCRVDPPHPLFLSLVATLAKCDNEMPGYAQAFIERLASFANRENDPDHYDQITQVLAELLVAQRCVRIDWAGRRGQFEPPVEGSKKRPDFVVRSDQAAVVLEVKAPAFSKLAPLRKRGVQLASRVFADPAAVQQAFDAPVVLPRDNPIKDFLLGAEAKFEPLRSELDCPMMLAVVWDDFFFEPISALLQEGCGLLTSNSFARDVDGNPIPFRNVDAVLLVRHLHYFANAAADHPLGDRGHAFDFGDADALPNVVIRNPNGRHPCPPEVMDAFRAVSSDHPIVEKLADYRPQEIIFWL